MQAEDLNLDGPVVLLEDRRRKKGTVQSYNRHYVENI